MGNLYPAFKLSDKVYLFDNFSEKTNGSFNFFLEKIKNEYICEIQNQFHNGLMNFYLTISLVSTKCCKH